MSGNSPETTVRIAVAISATLKIRRCGIRSRSRPSWSKLTSWRGGPRSTEAGHNRALPVLLILQNRNVLHQRSRQRGGVDVLKRDIPPDGHSGGDPRRLPDYHILMHNTHHAIV